MAIPTSACARAGASLTPSPTIATRTPPSWKRRTAAALSAGSTWAAVWSMPMRRATESATACASPVIMATRRPMPCSRLTASADSGRISSSSARAPRTAPSATVKSTVRPCPDHCSAASATEGGTSRPELLDQAGAADPDLPAVDRGGCAPRPASDSNAEAARRRQPSIAGGAHHGPRQRVLRIGFDGGGQRQQRVLVQARRRDDAGQHWLAAGQRAGLVEDDDLHLARALQRQPVLDQQPIARTERGADGDHQRDGQAQGVRAGDDQHRRRADQRLLGLPERGPDHERDDARAERHEEEQRGGAVRQHLRVRLRGLGLGDQPHDPGQGGLLADGGDPDAQAAAGSDGAGDDLLAGLLGDRARLAGDHRFVDIGRAFGHRPIGGDARPRAAPGRCRRRPAPPAPRPPSRSPSPARLSRAAAGPARRWPPAPA